MDSLIAAFDTANLVALGEGHWAREDSRFRLSLVRNPAFARKVDDIVVEFANPVYQAVLDRFVAGGPVAAGELQPVWRDTTQPGAFDSPVYEEFLIAVRAATPTSRRPRASGFLPPTTPSTGAPSSHWTTSQGRCRVATARPLP